MTSPAAEPQHLKLAVNGIHIHVARLTGGPRPLLLLHGWPEFWLTWLPVMQRLAAQGYDLIAPDLRGFGDSDKPDAGPSDKAGADVHARDMLAVLDALGLDRVGLVAHDVGAAVAQVLGRAAAQRLNGIFLFDCPYAGMGARWSAPEHLKEIWYFFLNQKPFAAELIGSSRQACATYFRHFLTHWAPGNPQAFDDVFDAFVDNFMQPGNLQGGFNWYISANASRLAAARGEVAALPPIDVPTCVRWGELDPVLRYAWSDKLGEVFTNLDLAAFEGLGHFPHREAPDRASEVIARFFAQRFT
jgi:pimeloyl-ACP methyl ester carboxylesterase